MHATDTIVRTKLIPPRQFKYIQPRPRLNLRLLDAKNYRVTIIQAGPGYGKSTALSALPTNDHQVAWYHIDADDTDPLVFLSHLIHSCFAVFPAFSLDSLISFVFFS